MMFLTTIGVCPHIGAHWSAVWLVVRCGIGECGCHKAPCCSGARA